MDIDRDTATIILNGYAAVCVNGDDNLVARPSQGFIDRVIDNFVNQVVERFEISPADIHTWAAAYGLQSFQYLDIFCSIRSGRLIHSVLREIIID